MFYHLLGCRIKQHLISITEPGIYMYAFMYTLALAQIPVQLLLEKFRCSFFDTELLFRIQSTGFTALHSVRQAELSLTSVTTLLRHLVCFPPPAGQSGNVSILPGWQPSSETSLKFKSIRVWKRKSRLLDCFCDRLLKLQLTKPTTLLTLRLVHPTKCAIHGFSWQHPVEHPDSWTWATWALQIVMCHSVDWNWSWVCWLAAQERKEGCCLISWNSQVQRLRALSFLYEREQNSTHWSKITKKSLKQPPKH